MFNDFASSRGNFQRRTLAFLRDNNGITYSKTNSWDIVDLYRRGRLNFSPLLVILVFILQLCLNLKLHFFFALPCQRHVSIPLEYTGCTHTTRLFLSLQGNIQFLGTQLWGRLFFSICLLKRNIYQSVGGTKINILIRRRELRNKSSFFY